MSALVVSAAGIIMVLGIVIGVAYFHKPTKEEERDEHEPD